MHKIPCFVLIYEQFDIIKKCLTFLTKYAHRLHIIIIENFSVNTNHQIKPYIMDLLEKRLICKYYLFEENIANNAVHIVLEEAIAKYLDPTIFPYVFITDGDLTIEDTSWIDEHINIMDKYKNVFICGCSLDNSNLPTKTMPNAIHWIKPGVDQGDYIKGVTGTTFTLHRTNELIEAMNFFNSKGWRYLDSNLHKFCFDAKRMIWARTKKAKCYHLTWDLYLDLTHPYTIMKLKNVNTMWKRSQSSKFQLYENSSDLGLDIHQNIPQTAYTQSNDTKETIIVRKLKVISSGFDLGLEQSGIEYNGIFYPASRGFTVYTITDETVSVSNFDTHINSCTVNLARHIRESYRSGCHYIISVVHDDGFKKLSKNQLKEIGGLLSLDKIFYLYIRFSYYFVYDNIHKSLIDEDISKVSFLSKEFTNLKFSKLISNNQVTSNSTIPDSNLRDLGSSNSTIIPLLLDNNGPITKQYHIVCLKWMLMFYREYIESFGSLLNIDYILLDNFNEYNYINSPEHIYIFCQLTDDNLLTKPFQKMILNTEQLTIAKYMDRTRKYINHGIRIIDYSIENIKLCNNPSTIYLPYQYSDSEIQILKKLYDSTPKKYDLVFCGSISQRRRYILDSLKSHGVSILELVTGHWGHARDVEIASCKMLINIHYAHDYNIYESMRCDRWAFATMPVVSEDSIHYGLLDVKKHGLITFCKYDQLILKTLEVLKNFKKVNENIINAVKKEREHQLIKVFTELK